MDSISIRIADKNDAALIAELSRITFYDTFAGYNTPENMEKHMNGPLSREKAMAEVGMPGNIYLLAFSGKEPAGYVMLKDADNPAALGQVPAMEIHRIYSVQQMIGKGVGRALMQQCIDMARAAGKKVIWLGVWEHNKRAIDFYKKWGFEQFGDHVFMLGDDVQTDWLMKKDL